MNSYTSHTVRACFLAVGILRKCLSYRKKIFFWMVRKTLFEILYLFASHTHDLSKARFCQIIINPLLFCFTKYRATNVKFFFCSIFFYFLESLLREDERCIKGIISNHHNSYCVLYKVLREEHFFGFLIWKIKDFSDLSFYSHAIVDS